MPNIGPLELAIVLVIVLLIVGPKRLPGVGRSLGGGIREFKDSITGKAKDDVDDDEADVPKVAAGLPAGEPVARDASEPTAARAEADAVSDRRS